MTSAAKKYFFKMRFAHAACTHTSRRSTLEHGKRQSPNDGRPAQARRAPRPPPMEADQERPQRETFVRPTASGGRERLHTSSLHSTYVQEVWMGWRAVEVGHFSRDVWGLAPPLKSFAPD